MCPCSRSRVKTAEGIKFEATSAPAPTPTITAIYPDQASRKDIDDGKIDLTIDGNGSAARPLLSEFTSATLR